MQVKVAKFGGSSLADAAQFRKVADRFDRQTAGGNGLFLDFHALVGGVYENSLQPILGEVGCPAFAILPVFFIAPDMAARIICPERREIMPSNRA